jgi:hypothetical protein
MSDYFDVRNNGPKLLKNAIKTKNFEVLDDVLSQLLQCISEHIGRMPLQNLIFEAIKSKDQKILDFVVKHIHNRLVLKNPTLLNNVTSVLKLIFKNYTQQYVEQYSGEEIGKLIECAFIFNNPLLIGVILNGVQLYAWMGDPLSPMIENLTKKCTSSQFKLLFHYYPHKIYLRYLFNIKLTDEEECDIFKFLLERDFLIHENDVTLLIKLHKYALLKILFDDMLGSCEHVYYKHNPVIYFKMCSFFIVDAIDSGNHEILQLFIN